MIEKKYPPYSKPLHELIKKGLSPRNDVYLFIGNKAWERAKGWSKMYPERTLMLQPWLSAFDFIWPVQECDILIIDTGYAESDYVDELAESLFLHDASKIRFINTDDKLIVYHKE